MSIDKQPNRLLVPQNATTFEEELTLALVEADRSDRRRDERFTTDYNVACMMGNVSWNVEVCDVSIGGARVSVRQGIVPRKGQRVAIRLMNGKSIPATVMWCGEKEIGIQFDRVVPDLREELMCDDMGADFYRSVFRFQIARG